MTAEPVSNVRAYTGTDQSPDTDYAVPDGPALHVGGRYRIVTTHEGTITSLMTEHGVTSFVLRDELTGRNMVGNVNTAAQKWELLKLPDLLEVDGLYIGTPEHGDGILCRYLGGNIWQNALSGRRIGDPGELSFVPLDEWTTSPTR